MSDFEGLHALAYILATISSVFLMGGVVWVPGARWPLPVLFMIQIAYVAAIGRMIIEAAGI